MDTVTTYTDWLEARRFRALALLAQGWDRSRIAEAFGVTTAAVGKWARLAAQYGEDALRSRPHVGRTPRLTLEHLAEVAALLEQGAEAHGFQGDVWTSARVTTLIARHFDLHLSDRQVRRLLRRIGWSRQKPATRARQRDEDAIAHWRCVRWPRLKRQARRTHRTILFVDESGVYLLPAVVRTWAPHGQTPVLQHTLTRDHLSIISAVSPAGALYFQVQRRSFDSVGVTRFLDALHAQIPGKLLVIWDGGSIHRGQVIQDYLDRGAAAWLRLETLPGYAPELNPDEGIWRSLKYDELKNVCSTTLAMLDTLVSAALAHMRERTDLIKATFRHAKLA
jgi:transposase